MNKDAQTGWWLFSLHALLLAAMYVYWPFWLIALTALALIAKLSQQLHFFSVTSAGISTLLAIGFALFAALTAGNGVVNALTQFLGALLAIILISMRSRRELNTYLLLMLFVFSALFVFDQSMLALAFVVFAFLLILWIQLLQSGGGLSNRIRGRYFFSLCLQALPLFLLLFLLMPRLGAFWQVPQGKSGVSGVPEVLKPGSVSQLTRSPELVFRVQFSDKVPSREDLYWRVLTQEWYENQTWGLDQEARIWNARISTGRRYWSYPGIKAGESEGIEYQLIHRASQSQWLPALDWGSSSQSGVINGPDARLVAQKPILKQQGFSLVSYPYVRRPLNDKTRMINLFVAKEDNPRIVKWIEENHTSTEALISALLVRYGTEFKYTLQPPLLSGNIYDAFFFDVKAGFCEHFASTTAFILRVAGIPTRVVTGYQGGEYNPDGDYYSVYQYDAHAWVEYESQGHWRRLDPTAAVSPGRIQLGFSTALNDEIVELGDWPIWRSSPLLNTIRQKLASMDYFWTIWVLGYQQAQQEAFLRQFFTTHVFSWSGIVLLVLGALILLFVYIRLRSHSQRRDPLLVIYSSLIQALGLDKVKSETPYAYFTRAKARFPELESELDRFLHTLHYHAYASDGDGVHLGQLKSLLKQIKRRRKLLKSSY